MLATELYLDRFPLLFEEYIAVVGQEWWLRPHRDWIAHSKRNPWLRTHFREQNRVVFDLAACSEIRQKYRALPIEALRHARLHAGMTFAAQTLSIHNALQGRSRSAFLGRVRGAFRNSRDMSGLRLELSVATHFARRGCRIFWPEFVAQSSGPSFDLLVEDIGHDGLEIECKSVSNDKGRRIDGETVANLAPLVKQQMPFANELSKGLAAVVTVPDRLPKHAGELKSLIKAIARQILAGQSGVLQDGTRVELRDFDAALAAQFDDSDPAALRETLEHVTQTGNVPTVVIGKRGHGALVVAFQSARRDVFLQETFDTAADAARRQLSGKRAGLVVVGLEAVEAAELKSLAEHDHATTNDPSALRLHVSRLLNRKDLPHLVGASFASQGDLIDGGEALTTGGTSYNFFKEESPYWHSTIRKALS